MKNINMDNKKKILFVTDYLPNAKNSVGDILHSILDYCQRKGVEPVLVQYNNRLADNIEMCYYDNLKVYSGSKSVNRIIRIVNSVRNVILRFFRLYNTFIRKKIFLNLKDIIKKENPALVVFFIYTPDIKCASICEDMYVKFIILLYDTFLSRPGVEKEQTMITEKTLIEKSYGYLVPSFFYKEYSNCYDQKKLLSYNLPLVIEREQVVDAFNCTADGYDFLYLGQIQQFRNLEKIKVLFNQMNLKLHVFTSQDLESDSIFQIHSAVSGMDMYKLVAHSKFLVAFDNSFPYAHYLPSKSYLYVSFTKPVIAFGDNDESALKDFFSDYRLFFYQNINKPLDKLIEFINNNTETSFDEQIYNQYVQFTPSVSSYNIVEKFFELSGL